MTKKLKQTLPQTQYIPVDIVEVFEHNPRKITDQAFEELCQSIQENKLFFEQRPCLVNQIDEKSILFSGVQRFKAAKKLGWKEVPCNLVQVSEKKMREWTLLDNHHKGVWDEELLQEYFQEELTIIDYKGTIETRTAQPYPISESANNVELAQEPDYNEQASQDLLGLTMEEEQAQTVGTNSPKPTIQIAEQYKDFKIFMEVANYESCMQVLNEIKQKYDLDNQEQALMRLIEIYREKSQ